jgi:hypothetical protein
MMYCMYDVCTGYVFVVGGKICCGGIRNWKNSGLEYEEVRNTKTRHLFLVALGVTTTRSTNCVSWALGWGEAQVQTWIH